MTKFLFLFLCEFGAVSKLFAVFVNALTSAIPEHYLTAACLPRCATVILEGFFN